MASTSTSQKDTNNPQTVYSYTANENQWTKINVGMPERWLSTIGGGTLSIYGLARRDWSGAGLALLGGLLIHRGITGHDYFYQMAQFSTVEYSPTISNIPGKRGIRVRRSLTIHRSAEDLYNFWSNIELAPMYMDYIESVTRTGESTAHWIAKGPLGNRVEWDSELLQVIPNKLISWHVHGKPTAANAGKVTFESAAEGRGTIVTLELDFLQLEGALGTSVGKLVGQLPEKQALETLRHFKELMETGEIPSIKGQPTGEGRRNRA